MKDGRCLADAARVLLPRQVYCVQHHRDESQPRGIRVELAAVHLEEPDTDIHNGIIFLGAPSLSTLFSAASESPLRDDLLPDWQAFQPWFLIKSTMRARSRQMCPPARALLEYCHQYQVVRHVGKHRSFSVRR